ncbi:hypothetical protein [Pedobacter rhodius]|uniref:Uncharacterized protein n=1 Tax=Pedobacter rhodius TaxID=3004098 RepID=A0ABT4L060_9SPHI|nr:hypothetical protein [Pedobacter sp. SJ11]MCZ4224557.1 hypothetical protein [Pedobacter sp. SJ11]
MRKLLLILAICLFLIGPAAKVLHWPNEDKYMIASFAGLILITVMAFVKKKD